MDTKHIRLVYIAGPYTATSMEGVAFNIAQAELAGVVALILGMTPIIPHKNFSHMEKYDATHGFSYITWLTHTMKLLSRCDAIIFTENWQLSRGAQIEHVYALVNDIHVGYIRGGELVWREDLEVMMES